MLTSYIPVILIIFISIGLASVLLGVSYLLGPKRGGRKEMTPYESGITPYGDARGKFSMRYYLVGASFILYDIEVAFLVVWAVIYRDIGLLGLVVMLPFLLLLVLGFIYEWKRGIFQWE